MGQIQGAVNKLFTIYGGANAVEAVAGSAVAAENVKSQLKRDVDAEVNAKLKEGILALDKEQSHDWLKGTEAEQIGKRFSNLPKGQFDLEKGKTAQLSAYTESTLKKQQKTFTRQLMEIKRGKK